MNIKVRFFAIARQTVGQREVEVELKGGSTARDLWDALLRRLPRLSPMSGSMKLAVNRDYVGPEAVLHDGDEVAVIPPVSGG